jgi:hypothetical protein
MLNIQEAISLDVPTIVEIDPYIPIAVRTYETPIGAVFYRVGNFDTSLVEIPIDQFTGTLRGIKVVSIDRVGIGINDVDLPVSDGLPTVPTDEIPQRRIDDRQEVAVSLVGTRFFIDFGSGRVPTMAFRHRRLTYLVAEGLLIGAVVDSLTDIERNQLITHLSSPSLRR